MIRKIISLFNIFGTRDSSIFLFVVFFSIISSLLELIGIGFLSFFLIIINDPSVLIEKINISEFKIFLNKIDKLNLIKILSLSIILIFILKHLILFLSYFIEVRIMKKISLTLKEKIFQFYLTRDYQYYLNHNKSDVINIIVTQTSGFIGYVYNVLLMAKELILIMIIFSGMLFVNWKLVLSFVIILFILTILFFKIFKKKLNDFGEKSRLLQEDEFKHLDESYKSIREIKLEKKEIFFIKILNSIIRRKNYYEIIHFLIGKIPKIYLEIIVLTIFFITVISLYSNNSNNTHIFGTLTFFALAVVRFLPAFIVLNNSYTNLAFFRSPFEIIYKKIANIGFKNLILNQKKYDNNLDSIVVENLKFSYQNSKKIILDDISFDLSKNDKLGIIGTSGSGKSTLLHLIVGLIQPDSGNVLFNKKKLEDNKNYLKYKISYVPQDSFILDTTIKDNIAFGEKNFDKKKLEESLEISNLKNFVEELPNKINSVVGDTGSKLSHGQRQRLILARAIYSDSKLIIFDESFNALDNENESLLLNEIVKLKDKILIFVAHKIETLRYCNKLLILKDKKVLDFGDKKKVLDNHNDLKKYFKTTDETN